MHEVKRVAVLSQGVLDIPHLQAFLPFDVVNAAKVVEQKQHFFEKQQINAIVGWGRKRSAHRAMLVAERQGLPFITLEDGFLRSVGLGTEGWAPAAMVIDDVGIYFDAHQESALERLILSTDSPSAESLEFMQKIIDHKLSKYNNYTQDFCVPAGGKKNILIVDQTFGDQSVACAGADEADFKRMLSQAFIDYPDANIWIKTHPEVSQKIKKGYLSDVKESVRVKKIVQHVNPIHLLEQMDVVYVVSSHMGFEALMLGKQVYCFGMTWYAGWGLTDDRYAPSYLTAGRRNVTKTIGTLFEAAYIKYSQYVNPSTGRSCDIGEVIDWLVLNKSINVDFKGIVNFFGFSRWKELYLKQYFNLPANHLFFIDKTSRLGVADHVVFWGMFNKKRYGLSYQETKTTTWVMEDGFIRSVGLGAKLTRPLSLALDSIGIYYDATQPSALENWYNTCQLNEMQLKRARLVRERLVQQGLSKYNVGQEEDWPVVPIHRRCILIPGQVEDDASILLGSVSIRTNLHLIQQVRKNHPDAFLVYKPHPDVAAGLRVGAVDPAQLYQYVDAVVEHLGMPECLARVDEVHTMTSLTGFEALLREVPVCCYGLPFYAGWGLTTDMHVCDRRNARLSLDELVYGALIAYPLYMLPYGVGFVQVEQAIDELIKQRQQQQTLPQKALGYSAQLRALALQWSKRLWP